MRRLALTIVHHRPALSRLDGERRCVAVAGAGHGHRAESRPRQNHPAQSILLIPSGSIDDVPVRRLTNGRLHRMPRFRSWDGTELAYEVDGAGPPLVCIPGGPGQAVEYLGDLGGLDRHRTLILLDNRGTGASQAPQDPVTYRVDQLVRDVEALRLHLELERMDLLGHSASGGICLLYAVAHPDRLDHLVLVSPSLRVVGVPSNLGVDEVLALRAHEPWYDDAVVALYADAASPEDLERFRWLAAPLLYRRWDAVSQAQTAAEPAQFTEAAREGFYAGFDPDPELPEKLAASTTPVLLVAGEYDIWPTPTSMRELAALLGNAHLEVLPAMGHFGWVDDPASFTRIVGDFLTDR